MYYWDTTNVINIALNNPLVGVNGTTYFNNLTLYQKGSTAELVWNANEGLWYVLSSQGSVGYD